MTIYEIEVYSSFTNEFTCDGPFLNLIGFYKNTSTRAFSMHIPVESTIKKWTGELMLPNGTTTTIMFDAISDFMSWYGAIQGIQTIMNILTTSRRYIIYIQPSGEPTWIETIRFAFTQTLTIPYLVEFNAIPVQDSSITSDQFKELFGQSTSNTSQLYIQKNPVGIEVPQCFMIQMKTCTVESESGISTFLTMNKGEALLRTETSMFLQFGVLFSKSFLWSVGGKIPGIGTCKPPSGCVDPQDSDGFSLRSMWRGYNSPEELYTYTCTSTCNTESDCPLAYVYGYVYTRDRQNPCGDYYNTSTVSPYGYAFEKNKWYTITYHVMCGTEGNHDGQFRIYIAETLTEKGQLVCDCSGFLMIPTGTATEDLNWVFLLSCFRGGSECEWTSNETGNIYYTYFQMTNKVDDLRHEIDTSHNDECQCVRNDKLG